jgi:hypothetical protein
VKLMDNVRAAGTGRVGLMVSGQGQGQGK